MTAKSCPRVMNPGIPVHIFINRMVAVAICVGVALTYFVSEWCHLILLFVAVNFFQSTFNWGICPPTIVMGKLGWIAEDNEEPIVLKDRIYLFGRNKPETTTTAADEIPETSPQPDKAEEATEAA
eukprot:scaffold112_cov196-Amphora_coffeaeformis.AAC.1